MTRFRSSLAAVAKRSPRPRIPFTLAIFLIVAGCASSSGAPATAIAQPDIAAAYLPLHAYVHLGIDSAEGAAVVIAPGIAVTNGHNANLLDAKAVIGTARDYDLLFFRTSRNVSPPTAAPAVGGAVTAYGQGIDNELRVAHGVVREVQQCTGCSAPAYFTFAGNAGPGFSGGPVLDASGRLVGITFGYRDSGAQRLMYAYDMSRVQAELAALAKAPN